MIYFTSTSLLFVQMFQRILALYNLLILFLEEWISIHTTVILADL